MSKCVVKLIQCFTIYSANSFQQSLKYETKLKQKREACYLCDYYTTAFTTDYSETTCTYKCMHSSSLGTVIFRGQMLNIFFKCVTAGMLHAAGEKVLIFYRRHVLMVTVKRSNILSGS